jgi:hypothetical protein
MRMFETGELVLFAALVTVLNLMVCLQVALAGAHVYVSSAPILALYATKAAVTVKTSVGVLLLALFVLVKHRALRTPRVDRIIRTALYAYITFTYVAQVEVLFVLESLLASQANPLLAFSAGSLA